jgi:hypothetical protein
VGRGHDLRRDRRTKRAFIRHQRVFFVATAPRAGGGHVNLSPKGPESIAVLGPREVAALDLAGSGIETVAHLRENARVAARRGPEGLRVHVAEANRSSSDGLPALGDPTEAG